MIAEREKRLTIEEIEGMSQSATEELMGFFKAEGIVPGAVNLKGEVLTEEDIGWLGDRIKQSFQAALSDSVGVRREGKEAK